MFEKSVVELTVNSDARRNIECEVRYVLRVLLNFR